MLVTLFLFIILRTSILSIRVLILNLTIFRVVTQRTYYKSLF